MRKPKTITKRELNQQTSRVLAGVKVGQPLVVTERGVARWRIEAVDSSADPVARLLAEGRITPPKETPAPWPEDDRNDYGRTPQDVDALLNELRGER